MAFQAQNRVRMSLLASAREREELRMSLREAFLSSALPASARVIQRGTQVVVVWLGRSHTFYT